MMLTPLMVSDVADTLQHVIPHITRCYALMLLPYQRALFTLILPFRQRRRLLRLDDDIFFMLRAAPC